MDTCIIVILDLNYFRSIISATRMVVKKPSSVATEQFLMNILELVILKTMFIVNLEKVLFQNLFTINLDPHTMT